MGKIRKFTILLFAIILASCGGESDRGSSGGKSLSTPPSMKSLYNNIKEELKKGEFESTTEYNNRINNFVDSLTGYYATGEVYAKYDADQQELIIDNPYSYLSEGENNYSVTFYADYTRLYLENLDSLYSGEYIQDECFTSDEICDYKKYRVLSVSPDEAERIIDGFRVDYSFTFSLNQIQKAKNNCISANYTQCINYLYTNVETFKIYNVVDGEEY